MDNTSRSEVEPLLADDAVPGGFRFAAVCAGIKESGRADLACAVAADGASASAMFTGNKVVAAPLIVGRQNLERSRNRMRVLLVNSGNANCATGEAGIQAARQVCDEAAKVFHCAGDEVFPSSTGIIGVPLPAGKLVAALPALQNALGSSSKSLEAMARAIMTTDTKPKIAAAKFEAGGRTVRLVGIAKGAGMIYPRLAAPHATMLAYIFTDAALGPQAAGVLLPEAVENSFNRISIDGDTSTNDTVLLLASGASGITIAEDREQSSVDSPSSAGIFYEGPSAEFRSALHAICLSLAKQIVADGEGVQHVVELEVRGAMCDSDALEIARTVAHSPLVKTAWAGSDPNWGRILAAVGSSSVPVNPGLIDIYFGEMEVCRGGSVSPQFDKNAVHRYLQQRELSIRIDLGQGRGASRFWTTDLTAEYVRINADYST